MDRAYSILTVKSIDADQRIITGIATSPEPDRMGDVIEPLGVKYKNPLPLLLFHDTQRPVGTVKFSKPTDDGIVFEAKLPDIEEPGVLRDRVNEAWQSVKAGLVKGVSIGFRALDDGMELLRSGGIRFTKTEVLELSLVTIPANAAAMIQTIKSIDAPYLAASGTGQEGVARPSAGATAPVTRTARKGAHAMKTITEQIASYEAKRQANDVRMGEIMQKASDEGVTLDDTQKADYDTLDAEVKEIDDHLTRLRAHEQRNKAAAKPVVGDTIEKAAASRGNGHAVISVQSNLPGGIEFARAIKCKVLSRLDGMNAVDIAKAWYPDQPRIQQYLKGAVPAATTTDSVWMGAAVDPTNLAGEFIEFLRPQTIIGKFGTGGIPSLRRVPFNVRILGQTSGGEGYWVGQGAPKPLTSFQVAPTTLTWAKVANIAVVTEELLRFSSLSADAMVRDELARAIIERLD
ncbi:MAG: phage major capsid protein, partial [Actinomycetota bacterium]|nr:phage major capsid protein [Actinomycetota bacterium]